LAIKLHKNANPNVQAVNIIQIGNPDSSKHTLVWVLSKYYSSHWEHIWLLSQAIQPLGHWIQVPNVFGITEYLYELH
jgi:hypothetical protein